MEKPEFEPSQVEECKANMTADLDGDEPEVRLRDGIDLEELQKGKNVFFEVEDADIDNDIEDQSTYRPQDVYDHLSRDAVDYGDDDEDEDEDSPFERLAKTMTNLTEDGGIMKKVLSQGVGNKVPEAAYVTIHYNAYVEDIDTPFDSSRIKERPFRFRLGKEDDALRNVIWGLDIAIASMFKQEKSQFLIQPQYAYGRMGCPPRIPANATLLYEIELIDFTDTMGMDQYYSLTHEQRRDAPLEIVSRVVERERKEGNEFFERGQYSAAIRKYKKAVQHLNEIRLKDEKEESSMKRMLLRVLLNLGLAYMKEKYAKKCLSCMNEAYDIDRNNAKVFYYRGKCLIMLAEFDRARDALMKAKELKPRDKFIIAAFEELERKKKRFNFDERKLAAAMLGLRVKDEKETDKVTKSGLGKEYTEEFKSLFEEQIKEFLEDEDLTEFPLRMTNLTSGEIKCIHDIAEQSQLTVVKIGRDSNEHFRIKKPEKPPSNMPNTPASS